MPLCGTGTHPHFLFGCAEKKTAVHGQKKRRFERPEISPLRENLAANAGVGRIACVENLRGSIRLRYTLAVFRRLSRNWNVGRDSGILTYWPAQQPRVFRFATHYVGRQQALSICSLERLAIVLMCGRIIASHFTVSCFSAIAQGVHSEAECTGGIPQPMR